MYLCSVWVCTSSTRHMRFFAAYGYIYLGLVCEYDSMYTHTFSRYIWALASMHTCNISRNVHARAYMIFCECDVRTRTCAIFRARASTIILACTSTCLCVCARAPSSIRACVGCYPCLFVVMSNTLLWIELGHVSRTAHIYIWGALRDSLYHIL